MEVQIKFFHVLDKAIGKWGAPVVFKSLVQHFSISDSYGDLITNVINPLVKNAFLPRKSDTNSLQEIIFTLTVWIEDDKIKPKQWSAYKPPN